MRRDGLQHAAGAIWLLIGAGLLARGMIHISVTDISDTDVHAYTTSVFGYIKVHFLRL